MTPKQPADPAEECQAEEPLADQPGLAELRAVVAQHVPHLPRRAPLGRDIVAGLSNGINNVPDGMASDLLAGADVECRPPHRLASNETTVLDVYGHLFFAGARTLEARLPAPQGAQHAVVILRLRGRTHMSATLIDVLADYAEALRTAQGRLYLSGLGADAYEQVRHSGKLRLSGPVRMYEVTPFLGEFTKRAYADAQAWLLEATNKDERK